MLRTTATTGKSYAEVAKSYKTVEAAIDSTKQQPEKPTSNIDAAVAGIKDNIIKEVTEVIEKSIGQLKVEMHRAIDDNFELVKTYVNEVKDTIDSDYDRRDEELGKSIELLVPYEVYYADFFNFVNSTTEAVTGLASFRKLATGNKPTTKQYDDYWDSLMENLGHLNKLVDFFRERREATTPTKSPTTTDAVEKSC